MVYDISNENLKFYVIEMQVSNLLENHEMAFLNYLSDVYLVGNKTLEKKDLMLVEKLYILVQERKGYGHC